MNIKTMEMLETLEEKIEAIKWLMLKPIALKKYEIPPTAGEVEKSAGMFNKNFTRGIILEDKIRKNWEFNFIARIKN